MEVDVSKLSSVVPKYTDIVKKKMTDAINNVVDEASRELIPMYFEGVDKAFRESIDEFYSPSSYEEVYYDRTYSLYNILEKEQRGDSVAIWFEPSKMSGYRSGYRGEDGLYDLVFRKGYHGGASSGSYKGSGFYPHPNPGVPYWRKPYPTYKTWGRPAAVSTPPLDIFDEKREAFRRGEFLERATALIREKLNGIKIDW